VQQSLQLYLQDRPTAYLEEMAYYLFDCHGVDVSEKTVSRLLREAEWSRKRAKKEAKQRNEELRAHWRAKRMYWQPWQLVFLDESACAPRTGDRKYGWSPAGLPCFDTQRLRRDARWSVLPALTVDGYMPDPLIVLGGVQMHQFEEWFEEKVLPQLRPAQIVIMDNASIHGSDLVAQLCQDAGIQLEYLPPYSPDLNPIEESFNVLKAWVKRNIRMACVFRDFGTFMAFGVREVGVVGAQGYFEDCGYC
jgi:transposase InsO family protein